MTTTLFSPISIKTMTLKNRVVFAPIATNYGIRNAQARHYYAERARGGAGLVMLQGTPVEMLSDAKWAAPLAALTAAVHEEGSAVGIQLWAGNKLPNGDMVAPSAREGHREATPDELTELAQRFALAARHAVDVGFDTVELHGAHGYFLHQFFSPLTNQRTDRFGGTVEKRMELGLECVRAVRAEVGGRYPVCYRLSAIESAPGGIALEDSVLFARELEKAGVDLIDVSAGGALDRVNLSLPQKDQPLGTHAGLAAAIRKAVSVPVVAVGRFNTKEVCEEALQTGKADLIAVGRQLLADPFWPVKLQEGRASEVVTCVACNTLCMKRLRENEQIGCAVNPEVGKEHLRFREM